MLKRANPFTKKGDRQYFMNLSIIMQSFCNRSITAKDFLLASKKYREEQLEEAEAPVPSGMVTCTRDHTLKEVILTLDSLKIHRIYVVDKNGSLEGVITLRDIISRLVHEPPNYFGDFFDGVLPMPANSRV